MGGDASGRGRRRPFANVKERGKKKKNNTPLTEQNAFSSLPHRTRRCDAPRVFALWPALMASNALAGVALLRGAGATRASTSSSSSSSTFVGSVSRITLKNKIVVAGGGTIPVTRSLRRDAHRNHDRVGIACAARRHRLAFTTATTTGIGGVASARRATVGAPRDDGVGGGGGVVHASSVPAANDTSIISDGEDDDEDDHDRERRACDPMVYRFAADASCVVESTAGEVIARVRTPSAGDGVGFGECFIVSPTATVASAATVSSSTATGTTTTTAAAPAAAAAETPNEWMSTLQNSVSSTVKFVVEGRPKTYAAATPVSASAQRWIDAWSAGAPSTPGSAPPTMNAAAAAAPLGAVSATLKPVPWRQKVGAVTTATATEAAVNGGDDDDADTAATKKVRAAFFDLDGRAAGGGKGKAVVDGIDHAYAHARTRRRHLRCRMRVSYVTYRYYQAVLR